MKFSKGTKIMLDRDWSNIENVEFEIVKIYPLKNEVMVRITDNGLKVLKKQVRDFIYNFVIDDLRKLLHFGQDEDLEPHAYKQVIDAFIEEEYLDNNQDQVRLYE